ncbi:MAG: hypothetical protein AB1498_06485 [bacterium]
MKDTEKNISKNEETDHGYNVDYKNYISGISALFFSIVFAWLMIPIIVNFINPSMIDMAEIEKIFIPSVLKDIYPEPMERTMFLTGIVLLPVLLLIFICLFNYIFKNITDLSVIKYSYNVLFIVFLGMIAYLTWVSNKKNQFFYFQTSIRPGVKSIFSIAVISFLMNLLILNAQKNYISKFLSKTILFLTNSICWIIILYAVLINVYGISLVRDMGTYRAHLEGVFHSVVQVFLGKQILYNLVSQYGFYPHLLEPVWRIIGLNVFKFTLIMGLLMGISLVLFYLIFKKLVDNKIIAYLGFITSIWLIATYGRVIFMYNWYPSMIDPYFQFFPIRFLFPVFSIYFTYYYLKTSSKKIYYMSFVAYSISILWNFDTGFVVYLTWLITLIYEGICSRDVKKIIFHIANWIIIFFLTIAFFTSYMYLRYGHLPMYKEFLLYQRMYYVFGFGMLPMPLIHPWNLVAIVYLVGLAISLINLLQGKNSLKVSMIFNLSILGVGVFSYYQGRSHDFNMTGICYPAIVLLAVFADALLEKYKRDRNVFNFVALNYIIFFMIFFSMSFIKNYKIIFTTLKERVMISLRGENTPVKRSAEFIKNNTKRGEEILLLSNLSAIYYLESRTITPIKSEPRNIVMVSQEKDVLDYLGSNLCKKVFLDVNIENKTIWNFVQTNFKLSLISPDNNIGLFIK